MQANNNVGVYEITGQEFVAMLKNLKNVLNKAKVWGEPKKVEMSVFLSSRLAPDMFPLLRQIQITCDNAKACMARLSGVTAPIHEDKEQTMDELMQRIDKTIQFIQTIKPEQLQDYESKTVEFPWNPGQLLSGKDYLTQFALPNFYFHMTTAYAILRNCGVDLGKGDFIGELNWKKK